MKSVGRRTGADGLLFGLGFSYITQGHGVHEAGSHAKGTVAKEPPTNAEPSTKRVPEGRGETDAERGHPPSPAGGVQVSRTTHRRCQPSIQKQDPPLPGPGRVTHQRS
jgi:hypothetical protein